MTKEEKKKESKKRWRDNHPEYGKHWRNNHPEYNKHYYNTHKEEVTAYGKNYYNIHREERLIYGKNYYNTHRKERLAYNKRRNIEHLEKRRELSRKEKSKRRNLGFISMNKPFKGCEFHHLDRDSGIYIPKWLHKACYPHNVWTGKGMDKANEAAIHWWMISQCKKASH